MHIPEHPDIARGLFELLSKIEAAIGEAPMPTTAALANRHSNTGDVFWAFPQHQIMVWTAGRGLAGIQIEKPSSHGGWFGFCAWTPANGLGFAEHSLQRLLDDAKNVRPLRSRTDGVSGPPPLRRGE